MRGLTCIVLISLLGGCGYIYPGFEGIFGLHSYIHDIPVSRVTTQLECEMYDFLQADNGYYAQFLDPTKPAGISIKFQTDQSGSFQYLGINLKEVGLAPLANLITVSSKTPSLQAKVTAHGTTYSQLDLSIPQTITDQPPKPDQATVGKLTGSLKWVSKDTKEIEEGNVTGHLSWVPKKNNNGEAIEGLDRIKNSCDDPTRKLLAPLSLQTFLWRFFNKVLTHPDPNLKTVCMSKITLSTQIVLILDVSAGVNPLLATTFILPVSGETFDYNPQATQNLNIVLALKPNNPIFGNPSLCSQSPQPQVTL